ncbi:FAD-dependent monooxygenase [Candidatus Pelagibacter communis]|uniref:FAD-dependent monooxygenase n=1 Tax=Pelagibacter ubique TaxID=198252 RepID=UPI0003AB125F|nr:FAD-dependent monooxygenase [Candidatus Pelagibacter ubique]MDB9714359.1 FAD-dependent monooxygenase [Candidatus Pelagibacter ubique]
MNVCIIGEGLTALSLAKSLINKKINVHYYYKSRNSNFSSNRTIGISKSNFEFFKEKIFQISKNNYWKINRIEIYTVKIDTKNLLKFENDKNDLFYIIKNDELLKSLNSNLIKSKLFKKIILSKNINEEFLNKKEYDLIINCDANNFLAKKYFTKKIIKNYYNLAYTTILKHKKIDNNTATQIFTKQGPIAFLPISSTETSVVYSIDIKNKKFDNNDVIDLINKNNPKYLINKIDKLNSFELSSSNLRNYYYKNILAFGDMLHRVHPLAGQGFNMTIRDLKILTKIIEDKIELGMQLDSQIFDEFEKKTKDKNFVFSKGIDLIYESFHLDKKVQNKSFSKILKRIGKNKNLNNYFIKLADAGINF